MFVRFVVGADDEDHRLLTGVITEARLMWDAIQLYPYEEGWLEEIYGWFNSNLPTPPFSTGGFTRDAVAWFKTESAPFITRMWDLVANLENQGCWSGCFDLPIQARSCSKMTTRSS